MAQNYVVMARKNLLKPSEAPKYYAVARSGRKVTVKEVCKRITERSSYSKGELEGCIVTAKLIRETNRCRTMEKAEIQMAQVTTKKHRTRPFN